MMFEGLQTVLEEFKGLMVMDAVHGIGKVKESWEFAGEYYMIVCTTHLWKADTHSLSSTTVNYITVRDQDG